MPNQDLYYLHNSHQTIDAKKKCGSDRTNTEDLKNRHFTFSPFHNIIFLCFIPLSVQNTDISSICLKLNKPMRCKNKPIRCNLRGGDT